MIDYTCPKCGTAMSSPDSLAGKTEKCPGCGYECPVALTVIDITPGFRITYPHIRKAWRKCRAFYSAHPWPARGIIAGILVVVLIVFFAALSDRGHFPNRSELTELLAEHKYFPTDAKPTEAILRGRKLYTYRYCRNANFPETTKITLYCRLDDTETVVAMSAVIITRSLEQALDDLRLTTRAIAEGKFNSREDRQRRAISNHSSHAPDVLEAISGISYREAKFDRKEMDTDYIGITTRVDYYFASDGGFELERIDTIWPDSDQKKENSTTLLILKDKSWQ